MAKILVIDDIEFARETISEILRRGGYDVIQASTGKAGLKLFKEEGPDLVVTDVLMPDMEAIDAIESLKKVSPDLPVVAITGSIDSPYLDSALEFAAVAGLRKPFKQTELLELVGKQLAAA